MICVFCRREQVWKDGYCLRCLRAMERVRRRTMHLSDGERLDDDGAVSPLDLQGLRIGRALARQSRGWHRWS